MKLLTIFKLFGFRSSLKLFFSIRKHGFNLMSLLHFAKDSDIKEAYIQDDSKLVSYNELYTQSIFFANYLQQKFNIRSQSKVAIVTSNSIEMVKSMFSISSLGADIFLLNSNQKQEYYNSVFINNSIDLIISESDTDFLNLDIPYFKLGDVIDCIHKEQVIKCKNGSIVVFSSGTTGSPKKEKRKLGFLKFALPSIDIVHKLKLLRLKSVLISVPIFHGYGLAALLVSVFLKKRIRLTRKFETEKAFSIIEKEDISCWIAVPLMINKMISLQKKYNNNFISIISGGDVLPSALVQELHKSSKLEIYNMYGTSETGVCTIATNDDLKKYPSTIGKEIVGLKIKIKKLKSKSVEKHLGELTIKSLWAADDKKNSYYKTGDLVYKNTEDYYFYSGRIDDLIVLGGENIYPIEVESIIYKHPEVFWVKVTPFAKNEMIIGLHLDIAVNDPSTFNEQDFENWMKQEIPKYMLPKSITILDSEPFLKLM